jgi:chromosome partitioning protein
MTARIICIANQKGGVAKTTTVVNLAAFLAGAGRRVLVVDMDPQANATTSLGIDPRAVNSSTYDLLIDAAPVQQVIRHTAAHANLDLLPAGPDLAGAEVEMTQQLARERLLSRALQPAVGDYDYVLIDDPPSLGLLTVNGLTAATHGLIIPVQCEYLALEGLSQLLRTVQRVREVLNERLHVAGVVMTMYDGRTNLGQQVVQEVRNHFPKEAFKTIIPRNVRLSEAPSYGQTIMTYAPGSAGALAYQSLTAEFIHRMESDLVRPGETSPGDHSRPAAIVRAQPGGSL